MADRMTPEQRHYCMSRIRSEDTRPEMLVRRFLWKHGYRYRLHVKSLPGKPDIVLRRLNVAVFINGCFWHGHECQSRMPRSNTAFWQDKIRRNRERDARNNDLLRAMNWYVFTIWECELSGSKRDETLNRLLTTLRLYEVASKEYRLPVNENVSIAAENDVSYNP